MALRIPRVVSPIIKHNSEFPKTYWKSFRENLSYQMGKYRKPRIEDTLGRKK